MSKILLKGSAVGTAAHEEPRRADVLIDGSLIVGTGRDLALG